MRLIVTGSWFMSYPDKADGLSVRLLKTSSKVQPLMENGSHSKQLSGCRILQC
jgi:hypothetical protein